MQRSPTRPARSIRIGPPGQILTSTLSHPPGICNSTGDHRHLHWTQLVFPSQTQRLSGKNHLCFPQAGDAASLRSTVGFTFSRSQMMGLSLAEKLGMNHRVHLIHRKGHLPPLHHLLRHSQLLAGQSLRTTQHHHYCQCQRQQLWLPNIRPIRHEVLKCRTQRCSPAWHAHPHSKLRRAHGDVNEKWRPLTSGSAALSHHS